MWDGRLVDSCLVVVDRHSGWVQAYPVAKKGLTAKVAALLVYNNWFCNFGVPRTICSDLRPQFKAAWFKTLCALQGVHHAQAVSYHSRSNGRAERACGQLLQKLRKLHQEKRQRWCEALPRALQLLNDQVGTGGVSAYTALFGRCRTMGYLPEPESHLCETPCSLWLVWRLWIRSCKPHWTTFTRSKRRRTRCCQFLPKDRKFGC